MTMQIHIKGTTGIYKVGSTYIASFPKIDIETIIEFLSEKDQTKIFKINDIFYQKLEDVKINIIEDFLEIYKSEKPDRKEIVYFKNILFVD